MIDGNKRIAAGICCSKPPPLSRIASVFPQTIAAFDIYDHKLALAGYLEAYALPFVEEHGRIVIRENEEPVLIATFDEQRRLTELNVTLQGESMSQSSSPGPNP